MKLVSVFLLLSLLLCHNAAQAAPAALGKNSDSVWAFKQTAIVLGEFDVMVSNTGLRATCPRSGITFVARPPLWHVVGFSRRSNAVWHPRAGQFDPTASILKTVWISGLPTVAKIPLVEKGRKTVNGLDCKIFVTSAQWSLEQAKQLEQKYINTRHPRQAEYQAAIVDFPAPACGILAHLYGVPDLSTKSNALLPIFYSYIAFNHGVKSVLITSSRSPITAPQGWLDVPAGFKNVNSYQELQMDAGAKSGVENLF